MYSYVANDMLDYTKFLKYPKIYNRISIYITYIVMFILFTKLKI